MIIDKTVAKALAGHFVSDELTTLHLADGREKRPDLLLELF